MPLPISTSDTRRRFSANTAHRAVARDEIPKLPPGVTVIYAHPVDDGEELRGYDYPHLAPLRASDAACLCNADIAALLDQHDVRRIGLRELRDLQRGG